MTSRTKGIIALIASAFGFALMALFVRLCDDYGGVINSFQKSFFRNLVAFAVAFAAFIRHPSHLGSRDASPYHTPKHPNSSLFPLITRSVFGTAGIFAHFYALSHISIAEAQTLNKIAPFFTVLFAWLFLGERMTMRQLGVLMLAFSGVLLIAKPGFAGAETVALTMGVCGGIFAGAAYACVRALRRHHVSPTFIVLFFSAFSCVAAVPFMFSRFDPMTGAQVVILLGAGFAAAIGQFGVTLAYGYAAPNEIAVFDYTNILFAAVLGLFFFGQVPDALSVCGFFAIVFAAFCLSRAEQKKNEKSLSERAVKSA